LGASARTARNRAETARGARGKRGMVVRPSGRIRAMQEPGMRDLPGVEAGREVCMQMSARMIPETTKLPRTESNEPTKGGTPSHNHLDTLEEVWQYGVATYFEANDKTSRQIDILRPFMRVAALCYGDFLRRVGRAYRSERVEPANRHSNRLEGLPAGRRRQGLRGSDAPASGHGKPMRCQVLQGGWKNRNKGTGPTG
jgi:hypothetical protein